MATYSSSLLPCICWEWQLDDGGFSPYPPDQSHEIEGAYVRGETTVDFACYTVDLFNMAQCNKTSGHRRAIRQTSLQLSSLQSTSAYWTWEVESSYFVPYSTKASIVIEEYFQKGLTDVNLSCTEASMPYTVNFTTKEQVRHFYNTRRSIQRCQLPSGKTIQSLLTTIPLSTLHSTRTHHPTASSLSSPAPGTSCNDDDVVFVKETKASKQSRKKATDLSKKSSPPKRQACIVGLNDKFNIYVKIVESLTPEQDEPCPICMNNLTEVAGFDDDTPSSSGPCPLDVCGLSGCGHMLHRLCLLSYIKSTATQSGFQCPTCKKAYGIKTGDMPDGRMDVTTNNRSLPGHPGVGTIQITYSFSAGVHNGRRYKTNGFPRTCYLPNSTKGQKVLRLLRVAWERRLTFTIGTSVTTGATNTLVWNEIHHKTEINNSGGHGYPDPNYLDNVLLELAAQGVSE